MKAPTVVRIASRDYRVILVPPPLDPEKRSTVGRHQPLNAELLIDASIPAQEKNTVLWHEIIHGIDSRYFADLLFAVAKDEEYTERLSEALAQVMRDLGIVFEFDTPT